MLQYVHNVYKSYAVDVVKDVTYQYKIVKLYIRLLLSYNTSIYYLATTPSKKKKI